jgi:hypothetical protein
MADHTGDWPSGTVGLLFSLVPFVCVFMMPWKVGECFARRGLEPRCGKKTGFWVLLPLVGGVVWLFRVQNSMNAYWESQA